MIISTKFGRNKVFCKYVICLLDGKDITHETNTADSKRGIALSYARDENGKRYIENGKTKREVNKGNITFLLRDNAPEDVKSLWSIRNDTN